MMIVATYDITADHRRSKVAAVLQTWGDRIQKSVYLLDLTAQGLTDVRNRCQPLMDLDSDSLYFFPLCASDWTNTICVGQAEPPHKVLYWAVL